MKLIKCETCGMCVHDDFDQGLCSADYCFKAMPDIKDSDTFTGAWMRLNEAAHNLKLAMIEELAPIARKLEKILKR